ncbi:GL25780 [Drosophila persimilis]|uniref:GL25780 n=1 Tax=Drosophila persimilis TaxID=7234 RepID=B4GJY8_DROPE|nr:GL25780 [Drosophila persimilis]
MDRSLSRTTTSLGMRGVVGVAAGGIFEPLMPCPDGGHTQKSAGGADGSTQGLVVGHLYSRTLPICSMDVVIVDICRLCMSVLDSDMEFLVEEQ